jgi:hypothetical protein
VLVIRPIMTAAACASISDSRIRPADSAHVTVNGSSTVDLTLVTSTRFDVSTSTDGEQITTLVESDTTSSGLTIDSPMDRTIDLRGRDRLYVELRNSSETTDATVDMRITVDGREVYRRPATIRDAALIFMYFLF